MSKLLTACVMSLAIGGEFVANAATPSTLPQLPRAQVDVTMPTVNGTTYNATCATLQAQINAAAAANVNLTHQVILATGTTCTGPFTLPSHTGGTGWILIKGANYASLPAPGTRVRLSDAALMPKIQYAQGCCNASLAAMTDAQRYRIMGIEFVHNAAFSPNSNFIVFGHSSVGSTNTGYFIVDRSILHDTRATTDTTRAVWGDADVGHVAMIDSYCAGIGQKGKDAQCFSTDKNPGPILVQNNFIEAAGEGTMLCGGIDPDDAAHMPQDATFRLNNYSVNPAWYFGVGYPVKTLFELKCGNRVLIEANTFENMPWDGGGFAFRLTVRNSFGGGTFVEESDITIRYNLFKNITRWIQGFGSDDGQGSLPYQTKHSKRWHIHDNLVYGLGWVCQGSCGAALGLFAGGATGHGCTDPVPTCANEDIVIAHNTIDDVHSGIFSVYAPTQLGLDFRDNLVNANSTYGIFTNDGSSKFATNALNYGWGATWTWTFNQIAAIGNGDSSSAYPQSTNSYPSSAASFLWTNQGARDYTLQAGSPAKNAASDGTDHGVNFSAYNAARAGRSSSDLTPPSIPQNVSVR